MVKLIGFVCRKTEVPTVTVTGMVVVSPVVMRSSSPTNVPAIRPPPGNCVTSIPIAGVEGAVPLDAEGLSQLPVSAVLVVMVQLSVPVPAFLICNTCGVADPAPFSKEKLIWPGRVSKNGPEFSIVRLTGTTIDRPGFEYWVKMISAV